MNIKNNKINADKLCVELTLSVYIDSKELSMYNIVSGELKFYHDIAEDDIGDWIIESSFQAMENSSDSLVEEVNIIEA